jgi:tetratricopeptide (TPR) repeat protein
VLKGKDVSYQPFHIFRKLIAWFENQLTTQEKVLLFLHFERYENCLQLSRRKELASASFVLDEIRGFNNNFPSCVQHGMQSLFNAMFAYYEFASGYNENALKLLDVAIGHAEQQGKNFPLMLGSIGEQWLNKVRVYLKINDTEAVVNESAALFELCLRGKYSNEEVTTLYRTLDYSMHKLLIDHVINSVGEGIMRAYNYNFDNAAVVFARIFSSMDSGLATDTLHSYTSIIIKQLVKLYKQDIPGFYIGVYDQFEALQKSPRVLQRLVLIYYMRCSEQMNTDLSAHVNFEHFQSVCKELQIKVKLLIHTVK